MAEQPDAPQFGDLALKALCLRTVGRERGIFVRDGARCHGEHTPVVPCQHGDQQQRLRALGAAEESRDTGAPWTSASTAAWKLSTLSRGISASGIATPLGKVASAVMAPPSARRPPV